MYLLCCSSLPRRDWRKYPPLSECSKTMIYFSNRCQCKLLLPSQGSFPMPIPSKADRILNLVAVTTTTSHPPRGRTRVSPVSNPFTGTRQKDAITFWTLDKVGKAPEKRWRIFMWIFSMCCKVFRFLNSYISIARKVRQSLNTWKRKIFMNIRTTNMILKSS